MSTVDTLITAISAIVVNDIYRPLKPDASESSMLKMARIASVSNCDYRCFTGTGVPKLWLYLLRSWRLYRSHYTPVGHYSLAGCFLETLLHQGRNHYDALRALNHLLVNSPT